MANTPAYCTTTLMMKKLVVSLTPKEVEQGRLLCWEEGLSIVGPMSLEPMLVQQIFTEQGPTE